MKSARCVKHLTRHSASSAFTVRNTEREAQELAESLAERLASNAAACSGVAERLDQQSRQRLLKALVVAEGNSNQNEGPSKAYLETLFKDHDTRLPFGQLDRQEFEAALNADRIVAAGQEASRAKLPQVSSLSIALASSIPFVGMGAVDNAIMVSLLHEHMHADRYRAYHLQALELVAGSEIDTLFGAKLGLSTLAAAGLGNMVSDVAGVSMANRIENMTRKMTWLNEKAYQAGSKSKSGQAAKLTGSVVGVAVGCIIGMAPLMFMDTHEHDDVAAAQQDS